MVQGMILITRCRFAFLHSYFAFWCTPNGFFRKRPTWVEILVVFNFIETKFLPLLLHFHLLS